MLKATTIESAVCEVNVLIESTKGFEESLDKLSKNNRDVVIEKINDFVTLFQNQRTEGYRKLRRHPLQSDLNGYQSSLYTLKVSQQLKVILAVDEDPIFGQIIFTLFQVVKRDELEKAYKSVAESLYQGLLHNDREAAHIS